MWSERTPTAFFLFTFTRALAEQAHSFVPPGGPNLCEWCTANLNRIRCYSLASWILLSLTSYPRQYCTFTGLLLMPQFSTHFPWFTITIYSHKNSTWHVWYSCLTHVSHIPLCRYELLFLTVPLMMLLCCECFYASINKISSPVTRWSVTTFYSHVWIIFYSSLHANGNSSHSF